MTRYRLVTTGVPYAIPDTTVESPVKPDKAFAVAALHEALAERVGRTPRDTRIQHRDFRTGSWVTHEGTGA